jgi:adenylate cyclase
MEIERKFLLTDLPAYLLEGVKHYEIRQGYFVSVEGRKERVRAKADEKGELIYFRTYKEGEGLVRIEDEWKITKAEFEVIWPSTQGQRIEKTRYVIPVDDHEAELDIYKAGLEPLMTVEVEFDSEEEAESFVPPDWFGEEVTGIVRYTNAELAS